MNAISLIALAALVFAPLGASIGPLGLAGCSVANEPIPEATADSRASAVPSLDVDGDDHAPTTPTTPTTPVAREAACDRAQLGAWMQTAFSDPSESIRALPRDSACAACLRQRVLVEEPNSFRVDVKACIAARYGVACVTAIDEQRACLNARCGAATSSDSHQQQSQHQRCAHDAVTSGACKSVRTGCIDEPRTVAQLAAECATSKRHLEATAAFMCGAEGQRLE